MAHMNSGKSIDTLDISTIVHSSRTYLNYNRINNHDAALLVIHQAGGTAKTGQIKAALRAWRGQPLAFAYLWNTSVTGGYGFVGQNVNSVSNEVWHSASSHGHRRTYWYRVKNGQYRLTLEGFRRLAELQDQLN